MIISISKAEIFNEVEKRSSLEGSAIPERFEGVWASKEEGEFLDSFWIEGYTAVVQLMKRYLSNDTVENSLNQYDKDEIVEIHAEMPERYNSLFDGNVATDIKMLIACNILHGWLKIRLPESAEKYVEEAKEYSQDLKAKLLYRSAPTRTVVDAESESVDIETVDSYLNKADEDTVKIESGDYLNAAEKDTESISKTEHLTEADADTEKFESGNYLNKADEDKEAFDREAYLNGADEDTEVIGSKEGDTFAADRKCCDVNIYPEYEFIGKDKEKDIPMTQGWDRKFECCKRRY